MAIRPEWTEYFKELINKMTYYVQNYGEVEFAENEMTSVVAYHRSEILIRFNMEISENGESAEGMMIEVWESYISERKMGTCVLRLVYRNDVSTIWEYIPGDWDDRILSWR